MGQEIVQDRVYTVYLPFRTVADFRNMVSLNVKTNFKSIIKEGNGDYTWIYWQVSTIV